MKSYAITLSFLIAFYSHAKVSKGIALEQVVQSVLEWKRPEIIKSANQRLKKRDFHRGTFFKGDVVQIKKAAKDLAKLNLQTIETSRGFAVIAQAGKQQLKIEVEFVDFVKGRIKVAGHILQLNRNMTYLQVIRTIAPPVWSALAKQAKVKKTSFNFLIPKAYADDEQLSQEMRELIELFKTTPRKASIGGYKVGAKVGGTIGATAGGAVGGAVGGLLGPFGLGENIKRYGSIDNGGMLDETINRAVDGGRKGSQLGAGVGALLIGLPSVGIGAGVGLFGGLATSALAGIGIALGTTVDVAVTEVERIFSDEDKAVFAAAKKHLEGVLVACQEQRNQYYKLDGKGNLILKDQAVNQLQGEDLQNFQEFQMIQNLSSKLQEHTYATKSSVKSDRRQRNLKCIELAKGTKDLAKRRRTKHHNIPFSVVFQARAIALCEHYDKALQCFAAAPGHSLGEKATTRSGASAESERNSVLGKFLDSLETTAEGVEVLQ